MKTESRRCLGTGGLGIGKTVRQPSLRTRAGTLSGSTIPGPDEAGETAANVGVEGLESSPSDHAQQLSASAWVRTVPDADSCDLSLCIGQFAPSAQHAMRCSGVAAHPAHMAACPPIRPKHTRTANKRWIRPIDSRMLSPGRPCQSFVSDSASKDACEPPASLARILPV